MKLGFAAPTSGSWATPQVLTRMGQQAEELGYDSLWTFQRLLYPQGTALSETYHSVLEPLIALGFLASCTERVRLGVAVVNFPFASPILLAKQVAAIDVLSEGRMVLGLGMGWQSEEFVASGASDERRPARLGEYVRCLDDIFGGRPTFAGDFYRVPESEVLPLPVQRPRPPILVGGSVAAALRRAGRIGDGWISSSREDLTRIGEAIEQVRAGAREAGKDPAAVQVVVRGLVRLTDDAGADRSPLHGSAAQIRGDLERLEEQGVTEVFLDLNFDDSIGSPYADPEQSVARATAVLEALAPGR
jgi:probable F420-dependent oxidoreductase